MNPRLESSKKWSLLPQELLQQIGSIFNENFASQLADSKMIAEGRIYKEELLVRVGLSNSKSIRQVNFEASIQYDKKKENVLSLIHIAVDCIGSMFENYFKDKETEFPLTWNSFKLENKEVFLLHTTENSDLEKKADQLLSPKDEALVQGDSEPDLNSEEIKKSLGLKD